VRTPNADFDMGIFFEANKKLESGCTHQKKLESGCTHQMYSPEKV
jgi:hypothetical protein